MHEGWTERSSLCRSLRPTAVGMIRTDSAGMPRSLAISARPCRGIGCRLGFRWCRRLYLPHFGLLPASESGFGFDGGRAPESCFNSASTTAVRRLGRVDVSSATRPPVRYCRTVGVIRRASGARPLRSFQRGRVLPMVTERGGVEGFDARGRRRGGDGSPRYLASKLMARWAGRRRVGLRRSSLPGDVFRSESGSIPGCVATIFEIAELEFCAV